MLRLLDLALPLGGLALIALGWMAWPPALSLGWLALGLAFFAWVAEADGLPLPRPGRAPILGCGCWETPLAFTVRHRGVVLLFTREDDPEHGGWSDVYAVRQRPDVAGADARWEFPVAARERVVGPGSDPGRLPPFRAPRAGELRPARLARAGAGVRRHLRRAARRRGCRATPGGADEVSAPG